MVSVWSCERKWSWARVATRGTYMFDGDHFTSGLLNTLVHHSKATTYRGKKSVKLLTEAGENNIRTAKFLQDLVMACDGPVRHVVSDDTTQQSNNDRAGFSCHNGSKQRQRRRERDQAVYHLTRDRAKKGRDAHKKSSCQQQ